MAMDNLTIIKNANELLTELNLAKTEEHNYDLEVKQLKKKLEAEQQLVSDSIRQTVTARREEIEDDYRLEASKIQDRQKKVRAERSKAKTAGMKNRIQDETADLWEENRRLKRELEQRMKQNKVPAFCNTLIYYALYLTKGWKEMLIMAATFLLAFIVLPCGIYFMIPGHNVVHLIIIYIAVVVIFFGLSVYIGNYTKDKHIEVLREGRKIRDVMSANRRRIRTITRSIQKDRDEQMYKLENFDQRLEALEAEQKEVARRKDETLRLFNSVTVKEIQREIESNSSKQIETLTAGIEEAKTQLDQRQAKIKSLNQKITDEYVPKLGRDFMDPKALKGLEELLTSGAAANLTEAKNLYQEQKQAK